MSGMDTLDENWSSLIFCVEREALMLRRRLSGETGGVDTGESRGIYSGVSGGVDVIIPVDKSRNIFQGLFGQFLPRCHFG